MPIPKRPVTGLDDLNQRRRDRETINQVLDHSFDDSKNQTALEKSLSITPVNMAYSARPFYELERFGGGVGSAKASHNDEAFAKVLAIFAGSGIKGGTIQFDRGAYYFNDPLVLTFLWGIILRGAGGLSGGAVPGTQLIYTGTGPRFIDRRGALGVQLQDLDIQFSDAGFTGYLDDCGNDGSHDSFRCGSLRCNYGSSLGGGGCGHIDLLQAIEFVGDQCHFSFGAPSINGKGSSSYSNVVTFRDCTWTNSISTPIVHPGEAWAFYGCTFEAKNDGTAGAIDSGTTSFPIRGLTIDNCWFGDVTTGGGTWVYASGKGLNVRGSFFGGHGTSTTCINIETVEGAVIEGNDIDLFSTALNFGDANSKAIRYCNNKFTNVTNIIGNSANAPNDLNFEFTPNSPNVSSEPAAASMESFAATLTASSVNPVINNGTLSTRYTKHDRVVTYSGIYVRGSTTTDGTGNYFISSPFAASTALNQVGVCYLLDSGTGFQVGAVRALTDGTARIQFIFHGAGNVMGSATPVVPATGDELHWTITYLT